MGVRLPGLHGDPVQHRRGDHHAPGELRPRRVPTGLPSRTREEFITRSESSAYAPPRVTVRGYAIAREISRGGQAVIFEAIQESTGRKVAIRLLREGALLTAEQRARFEREAPRPAF